MKPIGVLGASGAVGAAAVEALVRLRIGPLRLGARNSAQVARTAREAGLRVVEGPSGEEAVAEVLAVDVTDQHRLREFVRGCVVVLDCTGPSYELGEAVPVAALAEQVACVLVTGEQPVHDALLARGPAPVPVVLSAGTLPGLSGLLPRLLAEAVTGPDPKPTGSGPAGPSGDQKHPAVGASLAVYTGGLERATTTVAADLVLSLGAAASGNLFGEAGAAWREGARRSRVLTANEDAEAPGFEGRVGIQPFLSREAERVAEALNLRDLDWYHVHPGAAVRARLATLPAARHREVPMEDLVESILRAAEVDLSGRNPHYRMVFEITRTDGRQQSLLVRSPDSYRLTGAVGACAVAQILSGMVRSGLHFADRGLDPRTLIEHLRLADPGTRIDIVDGGAEDEEGVL
ncbi:hypothetical protein GCM10022223_18390 [Kineosporia mesophila]|uniref:Saccharopine dehydrogenase NADP binding domain-containing protein n=1 Tax=Kineosporia mesophila TaxID=566012 RepID=A0ABP6ZBZ3_9ACTN|nr:hypothetical protein [Kineosporia mesophila]MCD5351925.1 hypothetical protein [Kineosporia mesophila]